jgi:hypothetical protein
MPCGCLGEPAVRGCAADAPFDVADARATPLSNATTNPTALTQDRRRRHRRGRECGPPRSAVRKAGLSVIRRSWIAARRRDLVRIEPGDSLWRYYRVCRADNRPPLSRAYSPCPMLLRWECRPRLGIGEARCSRDGAVWHIPSRQSSATSHPFGSVSLVLWWLCRRRSMAPTEPRCAQAGRGVGSRPQGPASNPNGVGE